MMLGRASWMVVTARHASTPASARPIFRSFWRCQCLLVPRLIV